jgi:hypothetical protein
MAELDVVLTDIRLGMGVVGEERRYFVQVGIADVTGDDPAIVAVAETRTLDLDGVAIHEVKSQ